MPHIRGFFWWWIWAFLEKHEELRRIQESKKGDREKSGVGGDADWPRAPSACRDHVCLVESLD